jgi:hypothetical protein
MPDGGGEDRKENPNKSESPTWKDKKMKNEGNGVKSTG